MIINTLKWNALSVRHQTVLMEAAEESVTHQRQLWQAFSKESMDKMVKAGLNVYYPDKAPFLERGKKLWKEFDGTVISELAKEIEAVQ